MDYFNAAAAAAKKGMHALKGISETEALVLEATSKEHWGPHGKELSTIARATRDRDTFFLVMKTLWKRLEHKGEEWRHTYKALRVFEFLIAQGAEEVVSELRDQIHEIKRLEHFQFKEPSGKDQVIERTTRTSYPRSLGTEPQNYSQSPPRGEEDYIPLVFIFWLGGVRPLSARTNQPQFWRPSAA